MLKKNQKLFVISIGGSLIFPNKIDINFLKKFKKLILSEIKNGNRFILITGGGKLCRNFQTALKNIGKTTLTDLDTIGIASTWLNAELLKLSFGKYAHSQIAQNPETKILFKEKILVGGGWKPGRSSDGAMVKYAETYKAEHIINLSNIDFVCDKDPNKFPNAKKLTNISWDELLKLTGSKWKPGANLPFDPTASKLAKKYKLKLIIANGKNLKNLKNIFSEKKFEGTTII